jgi:uncharacterized coiled-coil protein SlyX
MAGILKTLAIAASAGVAFGLCTSSGIRRSSAPGSRIREPRHGDRQRLDGIIDIEPLLDRLEVIERRFESAAFSQPASQPTPVAVAELTRRIELQDAEIERIRGLVDLRTAEIQSRLEAEMDARHRRSLEAIEKTIEFKVSERIAALEMAVSDQSLSIEALKTRAQDTDSNLQRLIVAIERLCERTQFAAPPPLPANPGPVVVPFQSHMDEARRKQEEEVEAEPRTEAPAEIKKGRFPLTRIFGMIAVFVLARALA